MRFALLALLTAACSGPPTTMPPDGGDAPFAWTLELEEVPEALLSVWVDGDEGLAVGGAGGQGFLLAWDGGITWRSPVLPADTDLLWWTFAFRGDDAYAVGESATLLRRTGGLWRLEPIDDLVHPDTAFYGVWGASPDDVWVVGGSFTPGVPPRAILHFDGTTWEAHATAADDELLFKVWGSAADDVWAVGTGGAILHWDGTSWSDVASGTTDRLIAVSGRAPGDVFAVGGEGAGLILHFDGSAWSPYATAPEPLSAVWTAAGRALYVGGNRGYLARLASPGLVTEIRPIQTIDFHALAGDDVRVLAVGADFVGGGGGMWDGTLAAHGAPTTSTYVLDPRPDAAPPDAPLPDGAADASTLPGPGDECGFTDTGIPICAPGLECWLLATSGVYLCTEECATAETCGEFGSACCRRPGFQTLTTVCIPDEYVECTLM